MASTFPHHVLSPLHPSSYLPLSLLNPNTSTTLSHFLSAADPPPFFFSASFGFLNLHYSRKTHQALPSPAAFRHRRVELGPGMESPASQLPLRRVAWPEVA